MPFKFGDTYKRNSDKCIDEFTTNKDNYLAQIAELNQQTAALPRLTAISYDPVVKDRLDMYRDTHPLQPILMGLFCFFVGFQCVCVCVYVCVFLPACAHLCVCVSVHACVCATACVCVSVHACMCVRASVSVHACVCVCAHVCVCVCLHVCVCVCVCA